MLRNKLNNKKKKKGFTLIELIVVLAVLAIIALIAIPNFNQIRENSKIKSDNRSADLIDKAITTLILDNNKLQGGTYTFDGTTIAAKAPTTEHADTKTAIQGVLGTVKGVQQGTATDTDSMFEITIADLDTPNPNVKVEVGSYDSDTLDK